MSDDIADRKEPYVDEDPITLSEIEMRKIRSTAIEAASRAITATNISTIGVGEYAVRLAVIYENYILDGFQPD